MVHPTKLQTSQVGLKIFLKPMDRRISYPGAYCRFLLLDCRMNEESMLFPRVFIVVRDTSDDNDGDFSVESLLENNVAIMSF